MYTARQQATTLARRTGDRAWAQGRSRSRRFRIGNPALPDIEFDSLVRLFVVPDIYKFIPHPHIAARNAAGPPKVADVAVPRTDRLAGCPLKRRPRGQDHRGVGTMWCAYAFAALALVSLPTPSIWKAVTLVSWISQTFLQLVLLSIIIVGQNVLAAASD